MKRARVLRIDMGWHVHEVASAIGVSKDMVNRYETGTVRLGPEDLYQLAKFFETDVETIDQDVETVLHRARIASPYKIMDLCNWLGITRGRFDWIEQYRARPTYEECVKLGELLGVAPGKLTNIVPHKKIKNGHQKPYKPREDTSICVFCKRSLIGHRKCKSCFSLLHAYGTVNHADAEYVTDAGGGMCFECAAAAPRSKECVYVQPSDL